MLTAKKPVTRRLSSSHAVCCVKMTYPSPYTFSPLFRDDMMYNIPLIKSKLLDLPNRHKLVKRVEGHNTLVYSYARWRPVVPNRRQLPFLKSDVINRQIPLLRSPDRKPGLADITRETSRIKTFSLQDAILYSYIYDIRFILFLCLVLGISIWWVLAPEPLVLKPLALASQNIQYLYNIVSDTFLNKVCSSHPGEHLALPCECGSPLNNEAKVLFPEPPFDPLGLDKGNPTRMKALAIYFATIVIVLALSESASHHGVYLNI